MDSKTLSGSAPVMSVEKQDGGQKEEHEGQGVNAVCEMAQYSFPTLFDSVTKRFFTHYIIRNCKNIQNNNCRLLQHSNSLVVLTLDPSHAAVACGVDQLDHIEFGSSRRPTGKSDVKVAQNGRNRSFAPINVVGKRKKNALTCYTDMRLCTIYMKNGDSFPIPACVNGFVIEFNAFLPEKPELLLQCPVSEGFLCIINVSTNNNFTVMEKVWTASGGEAVIETEDD